MSYFINNLLNLFGLGKPPIKVGILHSLTGPMGESAKRVKDATLMAINEINKSGGLLGGRKIKPIVVDGRSDWEHFKVLSERLINEDKVCVVFGCWSSAGRKSIKPIFEKYNHLLIYSLQHEGLEVSPNIVYTGSTPNQQIIPAIKWAFDNLGKRFFLVGSDSIFSRAAHAIITDQLKLLEAELVGDEYIPTGSSDVADIIHKISTTHSAVIINTINGSSNIHFFKALRAKGITPAKTPTMSFSIAEPELIALKDCQMTGDYAAWNYFQSIPTDINQRFVANYKKQFGTDAVTSDPIESAYLGVHLWALAVNDAQTADTATIIEAMKEKSFMAPEGAVTLDRRNLHVWRVVRIGKIRDNGQFEIVWNSVRPIQPIPYPDTRTVAQWVDFLDKQYKEWDDHWASDVDKS